MGRILEVYICFSVSMFCLFSYGDYIPLGDGERILELQENSSDSVCICNGLAQELIEWNLTYLNGINTRLGVCQKPNANKNDINTCTYQFQEFIPTRTTMDSSQMRIFTNTSNLVFFDYTTLKCSSRNNDMLQVYQTCDLDLVALGTGAKCSLSYKTDVNPWSIHANCTISNVFSTRARYNCQLYERTPAFQNISGVKSMMTGEGKYKNGNCTMTAPLPTTDGMYTYDVIINPGKQNVSADFKGNSSTIKSPTSQTFHTCPTFVGENRTLNCICRGDKGQPEGIILWNNTNTETLAISNVQRMQNGTRFTCLVTWNGQAMHAVDYTLLVAYGPDFTNVSGPSIPLDTNGSVKVNLTCTTSGVNPLPNITWSYRGTRVIACEDTTCTFTPNPDNDDGALFECQATNPVTGLRSIGVYNITLNYPPKSQPTISTTYNDKIFYEGDNVTLICSISGGKPINATRITFYCSSKQDENDFANSTIISSSVTLHNVTEANHNETCRCSAQWKLTNWYTHSVNMSLNVSTKPSVPVIYSNPYPFIAGITTNGTISCMSNKTGNPAATYTWSVTAGGNPVIDSSGRHLLIFTTIMKQLNGRNVSCTANNLYTTNRHPVEDATFTLQVYYAPVINISSFNEDTSCTFQSTERIICMVREGLTLHVMCTADSNPPPASISWGTKFENNPDLIVTSVNRTMLNWNFTCKVQTQNPLNNMQLPLNSTAHMTLIVLYHPRIINFTLNSEVGNITVNENDEVHFDCQVNGVPTPEIKIINSSNGAVLANHGQGEPSLELPVSNLIHTKTNAQCEDTGLYKCVIKSLEWPENWETVTLRVQCKPRNVVILEPDSNSKHPSLNFRSGPESFSFQVVAYPTPHVQEIIHFKEGLKNTSFGKMPRNNTIQLVCNSLIPVTSVVICNVTVDNLTSDESGLYVATFGNAFGSMNVTFDVLFNERDTPEQRTTHIEAIIGGIIGTLVFVAVLVIVVIILMKYRQGQKSHASSVSLEPKDCMIENEVYEDCAISENEPPIPTESDHSLTYAIIQFSKEQEKEGKKDPPKSDSTIYASIDFNKTASEHILLQDEEINHEHSTSNNVYYNQN